MTQPQVLQTTRPSPVPRVQALADACDDVEFLAQYVDLFPANLEGISSETIYNWVDQLEAAAEKLSVIARKREAQGK